MEATATSASRYRIGPSSFRRSGLVAAVASLLILFHPDTSQALCTDPETTPRLDVPAVVCEVGAPCTVSIDLSLAEPPNEESIKSTNATLVSNKAITCATCSVETPAGYGNCAFNAGSCTFFLGDAFDLVNEFFEGTIATVSLTCDAPGTHILDLADVSFGSDTGFPIAGCGQSATLSCVISCDEDGDCSSLDDSCNVGVCAGANGTCTTIPRDDGAACSLCPDTLDSFCHDAARAKLDYNEKKAGKEKMNLRWQKIEAVTARGDYGDPIDDDTVVSACIYDDSGSLVREFVVDRAGATCAGKACWKAKGDRGYGYTDKDASAIGISKMDYMSGDAGRGKAAAKGKNDAKKGLASLPAGVASALGGNTAPTIQMITEAGFCVGATLNDVKDDGPSRYRAQKR
jgi:hypothetical protein